MTKQRESGITWTEETWNPVRGCSRVSKGCMHCYAEGVANRFKGAGMPYEGLIASTGQWNGTVKMIEDKLLEPIRWKRPRLIFVNSMSDLFHESLTDEQIDKVLAVMAVASHHTFQVLTKRAKRMRDYFRSGDWEIRACKEAEKLGHHLPELFFAGGLPNVWIGVSVENQEAANERIPYLLDTPAAVRWVSAEPLLGAVDLTKIPYRFNPHAKYKMVKSVDALAGQVASHDPGFPVREGEQTKTIDWVVVGGESGTGARPMHPEWARSLRDQCVAAGVPFHFKQWGEWLPGELVPSGTTYSRCDTGETFMTSRNYSRENFGTHPDCHSGELIALKVGKKAAGRLLDGRTWDEYPRGYTRPTNKRTNKDEQPNTDVKEQPVWP